MEAIYDWIAAPTLLVIAWLILKIGSMDNRRKDDSEATFFFFFKDR